MGFLTGISDHGLLSGLADDDHTQYVLRNILTTDGDLFSRDAGAVTRIAAVAVGQVLTSAGTSTLPAWSATPTLTSLTCPTLDGGTTANADITIQGTTHGTRDTSLVKLQPNGGFVTIGTAAGGYILDIESESISQTALKGTATTANTYHRVLNDLGDVSEFGIYGSEATGTFLGVAKARLAKFEIAGGAFAFGTATNAAVSLGTNNTLRMVVIGTGEVGLATADPVISGTGKLHMGADTFRLDTARTPATAGAAGNAGDICWDASFIYVCTATNAWERAAIASW